MQGRRNLCGLLVVACVAAATSCSSGSQSVSSTPRITASNKRLEPGLIRQEQLREIPGLQGLLPGRLSKSQIYENPDPRGPCGAVIVQPDFAKGAAGVFGNRSGSRAVLTFVVPMGAAKARAYMDAMLADARPGCPPFESRTNAGEMQTVTPTIVPVAHVADQEVAASAQVEIGAGTAEFGIVAVRDGGRIAFGQYVGNAPLDPKSIGALAKQLAVALRRLDPRDTSV